jgi:hypothetical protein
MILSFAAQLLSDTISFRRSREQRQMLRTTLKFAKFLVGGHLLLGLALIVTEATHGINDQDPSFALALLVHYMNLPSVWLLNWLRVPSSVIPVVLTGFFQWAIIAFAMAAIYHSFRAMVRWLRPTRSSIVKKSQAANTSQ